MFSRNIVVRLRQSIVVGLESDLGLVGEQWNNRFVICSNNHVMAFLLDGCNLHVPACNCCFLSSGNLLRIKTWLLTLVVFRLVARSIHTCPSLTSYISLTGGWATKQIKLISEWG